MITYTVRKSYESQVPYLSRDGLGSFEPVAMSQSEAEHAAYEAGGLVQEWVNGELAREYAMSVALPRLVLAG